jgi:hypothetical protein
MDKPATLVPVEREGSVREAYGAVGDFLTGSLFSAQEETESALKRTIDRGGKVIGDTFFGGGGFLQAVSEKRQPTGGQAVEAGLEALGPAGKIAAVGATAGAWLFKQMGRQGPTAKTPFSKQGGFLGGEKAAMALPAGHPIKHQMAEARRMQDAGIYSKEEIFAQTGIRPGLDGKLKFEVSDKDMKWKVDPKLIGKTPIGVTELLDHPALFATYPGLKEYHVAFRDLGESTRGVHYPSKKRIELNSRFKGDAKGQLSTTIHELQHGIQSIEGFSGGATADAVRDSVNIIFKDEIKTMTPEQLDAAVYMLYALKKGEMEARLVQKKYLQDVGAPLPKEGTVEHGREKMFRAKAAADEPLSKRTDLPAQLSWDTVEEFREQAPKLLKQYGATLKE